MRKIQINELLHAVMYDLQMNGVGEYPHICDYLHGNAPAPYDYNYIAWNTAEGLIDWDVLDEARDNGDIEKYARTVVDYIEESYDRHCEWCNEGEDEEAFDDIVNKCDKYISDIHRQMLSEILLIVSLGSTITGDSQSSQYIHKSPATDDIPPEKAIAYRIGYSWRINVDRIRQLVVQYPQILHTECS